MAVAGVVVVTATAAVVAAATVATAVVAVDVVEVLPRQVVVSVSVSTVPPPPALPPQLPTKVGGLLARRTATAAVLVGEATVGSPETAAAELATAPAAATVENPTHAYNAPPHSQIVTYSRNMS